MTPRPRLLKALGVASIAAGLMLPSLPANAEDFTNPYKDPSNFLIGTTEDCLMRENYGRSQNPTTWAYCNNLIFRDTYKSKYDSPLTRLYLINILYRLAGAPEVKDLPKVSPYPDVSVDSNEYFLVIWATREGITKGWGDGKFHPEARVTTSTVTSFLYRAAGSPQKPWYYTWTYDVVPQGKPFWRETAWYTNVVAPYPKVPVSEYEPDNLVTAKPTTVLTGKTIYSMIREFRASGYKVVGTHA